MGGRFGKCLDSSRDSDFNPEYPPLRDEEGNPTQAAINRINEKYPGNMYAESRRIAERLGNPQIMLGGRVFS